MSDFVVHELYFNKAVPKKHYAATQKESNRSILLT